MSAIHWDSFFFLFFALVTCVFAVAVVVSNNIVRMASYLVASLCGVAGTVLPLRRPVPGGHATHAVCRRHRRAADLRRHAHGQGTVRVDAEQRRAMDPGPVGGRIAAGRALADGGPGSAERGTNSGRRWMAAADQSHDDPVGRRPGRRPHRQRRSIIGRREKPDATSATSCRSKSFPSISWSSSWAPHSWRGPSAASGPGNRGWS